MCLIIVGPSNHIRNTLLNTPELAEDIYMSNSDGIGAMYTTSKGRLRMPKIVPANLQQFINFFKQLPQDDRPMAIHARYKTHGDIDMENCHPYVVLPGRVAMMHNGVLSHGNKADPTKSDTWHYIKNTVRPQLEAYPKLFVNQAWRDLMAGDITGSNRFVFLDHEGDMVILNKHTGIEHDGLWFSNTYAWSPELLIPGYHVPKFPSTRGSFWRGYDYGNTFHDDDEFWDRDVPSYATTQVDGDDGEDEEVDWEDEVWYAISEYDPEFLTDLLLERPNATLRSLFQFNEFVCSVDVDTELSTQDAYYVRLLQDEDVVELAAKVLFSDGNARKIAEVACWYGDWVGKPINANEDKQLAAV